MTLPILLDGDPANDDALAVLAAAGTSTIRLLAVTAVAGHVTVDHAAENAAIAVFASGRHDIPVAAGAASPLVRDQILAGVLDLDHGLDRRRDDLPRVDLTDVHAVDLIIETAEGTPGLVIVATGPLTNIALALRREPRLVDLVSRIVILGGSWGLGNKSAAAEFNILCDPEAAAVVFSSGLAVTLVPVDATSGVPISSDLVDRVAALGGPGEFAVELLNSLRSTHRIGPGPLAAVAEAPLHDPTALLIAAHPHDATTVRARVDVELRGQHTYGRTVIDFAGKSGAPANADVVVAIDAPAVHRAFVESLKALEPNETSARSAR